jgi:hypothetical protein
MRALLKIPFHAKDEAKKIAKDNRCALFFDGVSKNWEFRGNEIPESLRQFVIESSIVDEKLIVSSKNPFEKVQAEQEKSTGLQYYNYVIDIPFSIRERIAEYGGYYNSLFKTYVVRAHTITPNLQPYLSHPFSYEAWIEKHLNNGQIRPEITSQYLVESVIKPRDYQQSAYDAVVDALKADLGGFLLADEVGLGKTISAGLVAQNKKFKNILVVTTLSAVAHWRKTFLKMAFNDSQSMLIINYDRLHKLFKPAPATKTVTKGKKLRKESRKTKTKKLINHGLAPHFDLVIWDESHKMKNNTAQRSKMGLKIADSAFFNLYMSATAGQNPLELSYLAPLLAKITGQSVANMEEFELWCKSMDLGVRRAEFGKWVWDGSDESIEKIRSMLFDGNPPAGLRRNPSDIAGYPEISRELLPLEYSPDELEAYLLAWEEFKRTMRNIAPGKAKKGEDNALVAKLRLRQKASLLKIPYTLEYIEKYLEAGFQVAVSVNFKETLNDLKDKLTKEGVGVSVIYGEQNATEKEEQRMKFQRGESTVAIFTVEEAISLHQGEYNDAPRVMLIHDLRWSAISMSQIEGRTHRDGKFSQIYWLYFTDSVEEQIAQIVLSRVISMKGMVGDDTKVLKEIEAVLLASVGK